MRIHDDHSSGIRLFSHLCDSVVRFVRCPIAPINERERGAAKGHSLDPLRFDKVRFAEIENTRCIQPRLCFYKTIEAEIHDVIVADIYQTNVVAREQWCRRGGKGERVVPLSTDRCTHALRRVRSDRSLEIRDNKVDASQDTI